MQEITTIGLDIAKSVFQVTAIDASGAVIVRRQLRRVRSWRSLASCRRASSALRPVRRRIIGRGRLVKLGPRGPADAAALCEALCEAQQERCSGRGGDLRGGTRPTMRFVPIKTPEQQSVLMLHRTRQLFVRQRTTLINAIRAHMAEFGIVAGIGRNGVERVAGGHLQG